VKLFLDHPRTFLLLAALVAAGAGWLAVVAAHDPGGAFGQNSAAWAQAVMSVGAILAAIVIDQGASRRDRMEQRDAAERVRAARVKAVRGCVTVLENAAKAVCERTPRRGLRFEGLALDALEAMHQTIDHYVARGSDDDPILVWLLICVGSEMARAGAALKAAPLSTRAEQAALERAMRAHAQGLLELLDEYAAGLYA
jgi:hypothetical protein